GVDGTIVRTQQVVLRDVTSGGGSGTYNLSFQNNRNADLPGFQTEFVSALGAPITSVAVPFGGQASFGVPVTANANLINVDPTEFQWFITATQTGSTQQLRMPLYYRAVTPTITNIASPVQGPILADRAAVGGGCAQDTNSAYTVQWSYTT